MNAILLPALMVAMTMVMVSMAMRGRVRAVTVGTR
jgi:hypothetical protein